MLQDAVLNQFKKKFNNPTYKEMVEMTGIEQTRLFRVFNGSSLRVDELEKFLQILGEDGLSLDQFFECQKYLDLKSLDELGRCIKRKLTLAKLQRGI